MGLINWLNRLFPQPKSYLDVRDIKQVTTTLSNSGEYDLPLVGESNYRSRIYSMIPSEAEHTNHIRVYFVGQLNLEDDNEYDKSAVNFSIDNRIVGYLSRADAKQFRKMISNHQLNPKKLTCRSVVAGKKGKDYGIWLEINLKKPF